MAQGVRVTPCCLMRAAVLFSLLLALLGCAESPLHRSPAIELTREARRPEDCWTPTRQANPPDFKLDTRDPKADAALNRIAPMPVTALTDLRFLRAGLLQDYQGLIDSAYEIYVETLCEWPDGISKSVILQALARNRAGFDDFESAVVLMEKSFEALRWVPFPINLAFEDLVLVAEWYALLGDEAKARQKLDEFETLLRWRHDVGVEEVAAFKAMMGRVYVRLGDPALADRSLKELEAQPALHVILGPFVRAMISRTYADAGRYQEAKVHAATAIQAAAAARAHWDRSGESVLKDVFRALGNSLFVDLPLALATESVVRARLADGDGRGALQDLVRYEEASARGLREYWAGLDRLAGKGVDLRVGAAAFRGLVRDSPGTPYRINLAWLRGHALALTGRTREAAVSLLKAVGMIENLRGLVRGEDRVRFFGKHTGPYHLLVDSLVDLGAWPDGPAGRTLRTRGQSPGEAAFYYAEAARARSLSEQVAKFRAEGAVERLPSESARRERELLSRVGHELQRGKRVEESTAYRDLQAFVQSLRGTHPDYAALRYPVPVTAREVPLREDEAVLAYVVLERSLVTWLLRRGREPAVFRVAASRDLLLRRIASLRATLAPDPSGRLSRFDARASADLYGWLLGEPLTSVPRGSRLVIVPDATLAALPFEVLGPVAADGTVDFVDNHYTVVYAPSATVLAHQRAVRHPGRPGTRGRALIVGDPVYDPADARVQGLPPGTLARRVVGRQVALRDYVTTRRLDVFPRLPGTGEEARTITVSGIVTFPRLPGTGEEARRIATVLGVPPESPDLRLGPGANEHDIKRTDLSAYRFLHFATHGVLAGDLPYLRQPALVLSQVGDLKGEDGFLTMDEVMGLRLRADLVVLSACQTGLGQEIPGEGVVSLTRAFLHAGSRAVVVSLWRVGDESTAVLMGRAYQHIGEGVRFAEALRRARSDLRAQERGRWAHPFFWAPFVLYGDD